MSLRIAFLGNGAFAAPALQSLHVAGQTIVLVAARPDRPQGKHQTIEKGPVAKLAEGLRLPLEQPESVNSDEFMAKLSSLRLDLLVVADFGQILSSKCLEAARLGGVNIHGSLLPKYRGAAPIAWAIYHGETETGVSVLQMTPKMDAGGVVAKEVFSIPPDATAAEVEAKLSVIGARMIVDVCRRLEQGPLATEPQNQSQVTLAPKLTKEHGRLRWDRPAHEVYNQFRAMTPWPGAFFEWTNDKGQTMRLRVLEMRVAANAEDSTPGSVLSTSGEAIRMATREGVVEMTKMQPAGGKAMSVAEFLRGRPMAAGTRLG